MKKFFYFAFLLLLFGVFSCSKTASVKEEGDTVLPDISELAIKTITEYQIESVCGIITEDDYDFVDENTSRAIAKSAIYQKTPLTKGSTTENDIAYPEQVPACEAIYQEFDIYNDGHAEIEISKQIGPVGNPAVALCDTPVDMSLYVAKIIVKDGFQRCYNEDGILLYEEPTRQIDYSSYIATLKDVMQQVESESNIETKSGVKRDVNWLRQKMSAYSAMTKASGSNDLDYSIEELPNGNVLLEQSIYVRTKSSMERHTSKIELSPDITRVERSESWENLVLKEKKEYTYDTSDEKLKSNYIPTIGMSEYNPKTVTTKRVVFMHDGTPMIKSTTEQYKQNQSYYFFNK